MQKHIGKVLALAAGLFTLAPAMAAESGIGVGLRASTLGAGVEAIYSLTPNFNLRGQGNFISLSRTMEEDGVNYDGKLDFQTFGVLADYHPFAGSFRLTGGLYQNGNEIKVQATCPPPNGCQVGNSTITSDNTNNNPARLTGAIDFNSTAPYAGIGWGNAMKGSALHFGFDIGVLFQGSPKADLNARGDAVVTGGAPYTGDITSYQPVQDEVTAEEQNLQKEINEFKLYPVISFTIGYRFGF